MPRYHVGLRATAEKHLAALDVEPRRRVVAVIESLAADPRPPGAIAIRGAAGLLRLRVGDYRLSTRFPTASLWCS
jgi:mRNA interferase RelE/StbE